ncbi:DUF2786 domain-containing protein [Streptomyces sp. NPDC048639]|uniref:DUF2786 domain-containing protein n=1 Tax=Streptomyces sp. NPDC048639 TaxID=3365581 RepID=UPI0037199E34
MPWETPDEEIVRLAAERHDYSVELSETAASDTARRAHLRDWTERRTARIRELHDRRPLGIRAEITVGAGACVSAGAAWLPGLWWGTAPLSLVALGLAQAARPGAPAMRARRFVRRLTRRPHPDEAFADTSGEEVRYAPPSSPPVPSSPSPGGPVGLLDSTGHARAGSAAQREATGFDRRRAIEAEHDAVREAYGSYVIDALAVLDRPALDDVTVPRTADFLRAMDAAEDARRGGDLDAYRAAVSTLKLAWRAADEHARRTGTGHLSPRESGAVTKARALLERAVDGGGGEHERRAAYAKARELLDGVLVLPRQAVARLETEHRLSLP